MLVGEARKGRYGVVIDVAYTDIEAEESTPGLFFPQLSREPNRGSYQQPVCIDWLRGNEHSSMSSGGLDIGLSTQNCR